MSRTSSSCARPCAARARPTAASAAAPGRCRRARATRPSMPRCAHGLPRLAAQFGPAQLDKALADAVLRAAGASWCDGVRRRPARRPLCGARRPAAPRTQVWLRHTVGPGRPADAGDPGAGTRRRPAGDAGRRDPRTTACAASSSSSAGDADADLDRLQPHRRGARRAAGDYRVTLDGNESFADAEALADFWRRLRPRRRWPGCAGARCCSSSRCRARCALQHADRRPGHRRAGDPGRVRRPR